MKHYRRENYLRKIRGFYEDTGLIKVISGVRRCGEYAPLEKIRDNYPKYILTRNDPIQQRNGIIHANLPEFMRDGTMF